jgi:hypothetical protein
MSSTLVQWGPKSEAALTFMGKFLSTDPVVAGVAFTVRNVKCQKWDSALEMLTHHNAFSG